MRGDNTPSIKCYTKDIMNGKADCSIVNSERIHLTNPSASSYHNDDYSLTDVPIDSFDTVIEPPQEFITKSGETE